MKILIRKYDDQQYYVWKDASYKSNKFYVDYEGYGECSINRTNILAIKDDNRSEYVICHHCGTMIHNDPESIEAHFVEMEANKDCFQCSSLRKHRVKTSKAEVVENIDGEFNVVETYKADLRCGQSYWNPPQINSEEAKNYCVHYRCRRVGVKPIEDIFTKYPGLFDKYVSVDVLQEKKCAYDGYFDGFFEYDLKHRNTIKACVNELGIINHFIIKVRSHKYIAFYSAKYDKLFFATSNRRDYDESMPYYMTDNQYNKAKEKISALYKEEESK